ncbi:hypothetical protein ABPG75_004527 [Micractinium tetrahymenae]
MSIKSPRDLSSPRPVTARRARHSARWRRLSLLLLTAAAVLYMAYESPGGRGGLGGGAVHVHVSVTRRLGMEQQQQQAGQAVLSASARSAAQRQHQAAMAGSAGAAEAAHSAAEAAAAAAGGAAEEEEEGQEDAELAAAMQADAAVAVAEHQGGAAVDGSVSQQPAAAAAGSLAEEAAEDDPADLDLEPHHLVKAATAATAGAADSSAGVADSSAGAADSAAASRAAAGGALHPSLGTAAALEEADEYENEGAGEDGADEAAVGLMAAGGGASVASSGSAGDAAAAAAAAAGGAGQGEQQPEDGSGVPLSEREKALRGCTTLECLREAHKQPKHPTQFNFPHFLILGFPKTATTSLFHHLIQHPTIMAPRVKEPNFFTTRCEDDALACSLQEQEKYITGTMHLDIALQARLFMAAFEGSVHYSQAGDWLAPQLRELMPWLKLVLSLREPISQAISMLQHNLDHDRRPSCYDPTGSVYRCLLRKLEDEEETYAPRLKAWADAFPADQLVVLQYENLTDPARMRAALRDVKRFIGIDAKLPHDDLGLHNSRKSERGWPMGRSEYERLVELARRDAQRVVDIVRQHGFADPAAWLKNWERAWQQNLEGCQAGPDGQCSVQLT